MPLLTDRRAQNWSLSHGTPRLVAPCCSRPSPLHAMNFRRKIIDRGRALTARLSSGVNHVLWSKTLVHS
jgi:hypothetical protein